MQRMHAPCLQCQITIWWLHWPRTSPSSCPSCLGLKRTASADLPPPYGSRSFRSNIEWIKTINSELWYSSAHPSSTMRRKSSKLRNGWKRKRYHYPIQTAQWDILNLLRRSVWISSRLARTRPTRWSWRRSLTRSTEKTEGRLIWSRSRREHRWSRHYANRQSVIIER